MRGDQLSRQWRIIRRIEASKTGLTATQIADLGNVSLRTAYRDLDDLETAGVLRKIRGGATIEAGTEFESAFACSKAAMQN